VEPYALRVENPWLDKLAGAPLKRFSDWPDMSLEKGRPGVYAIYDGDTLLYVGVAYRDREETANPQAQGVWGRLATHSRGTAPGHLADGVLDHFILPSLTTETVQAGFDRKAAIRDFIRTRCTYRAISVATGDDARQAEAEARRDGVDDSGPPLFNPLGATRTRRQLPARTVAGEMLAPSEASMPVRVRSNSSPQPPDRYPNPRRDNAWDNDAVHWLLDQEGAEPYTRGTIMECARRQPGRVANDGKRVELIAALCRRHGVQQLLTVDPDKGKEIWRLRRTDAEAPEYPDYDSMLR
jgi:hypothetical protein